VTDEKPTTAPDESDHLAYAIAMIKQSNVDKIAEMVKVAGAEAVNNALTLGMREVQAHALIAIAERLDRVADALEPRELDHATQDKINRMFDTMREAADQGTVPHLHMVDPVDEPTVKGRQLGACPECYVLEPFGNDHHTGCVVGTIIARLRDVRDLTARMHAGANGPSPEWREGFDTGFDHGFARGRAIAEAGPEGSADALANARKLDAIAKLCDHGDGGDDGGEVRQLIRTILRGEEKPT
jgi:hypothetical protein